MGSRLLVSICRALEVYYKMYSYSQKSRGLGVECKTRVERVAETTVAG